MNEAEWSRFISGLFGYISDYHNRFIETDYSINLDMSLGEVQKELMKKSSIDELPPELKKIAFEYQKYKEKHPS